MLIDLFKKGEGLNYLRYVYNLSNEHIDELSKLLYIYEDDNRMSRKDAHNYIDTYWSWLDKKDKKRMLRSLRIRNGSKWETVEDALEIFLNITGIKLDENDLSSLRFHCIHISPSIDKGESIRKKGLLTLEELLETDSPIKEFLENYGVIVCPSDRYCIINGEKIPIEGTMLGIKLYDDSEIQALMAGELKTLWRDYSCLEYNPEFLRELSPFCNTDLEKKWAKRRNALLYVKFDVSFEECSNISEMYIRKDTDQYERIKKYLTKEYEYGKEPQSIWRNLWFINACIDNSCPRKTIEHIHVAVKDEVKLGADRVDVEIVKNRFDIMWKHILSVCNKPFTKRYY